MRIIQGKNFAELYDKVMDEVYNKFDYETAPRGQKIRECIDVAMEIKDPYDNLFRYDAKEGIDNLDVFVYFYNKYLEVQECY